MDFKEHELSKIIPSMSEEEYRNLKEDIKQNGLINPIVLYEEKIIDGRHRFHACKELKIEIKTEEYKGKQPLTYIISQNIKRRHLTPSQLATIAVELLPELEKEAKERLVTSTGGKYPRPTTKLSQVDQGESREHASKLLGVGTSYISEAKALKEENKPLFDEVREGKKSIPEAKREIRKANYRERIIKVEEDKILVPDKKYRCIVIDPPWPTKFITRTKRPDQFGIAYPTMSLEDIKNHPLGKDSSIEKLAYKDCHLYLWTTHSFLPYCFEIVKAWGFEYKCLMTWIKNVGMTPMSWMYSTEHVLFCTKGNLPLLRRGMRLDFAAKVREHSRKPDEFYELVKKASPEPRIDIFSREKRDGFDSWGKESTKFNGKLFK